MTAHLTVKIWIPTTSGFFQNKNFRWKIFQINLDDIKENIMQQLIAIPKEDIANYS